MLTIRRGLLLALVLAVAACTRKAGPETASAKPATQPAASAADWKDYFDGKTLGKWKMVEFGGHGKPKVQDGALVLPCGGPMTGIVWTGKDDFPKINYEVELDAKRVDGSDFFCGLTFPHKDSHASLILGGWGGGLCGISCLGNFDAANNETTKMREFANGKWYHARLRVTAAKLQAWIDDDQIIDAEIGDRKVSVRWEVEDCRPLGFASYQCTAALKNIRIRQLLADEVE